jgi:hypothetical protein
VQKQGKQVNDPIIVDGAKEIAVNAKKQKTSNNPVQVKLDLVELKIIWKEDKITLLRPF